MADFWKPNLERKGRLLRALSGTAMLVGGVAALFWETWLGITLLASAAFVLMEAARGWCVFRACGVKTRY